MRVEASEFGGPPGAAVLLLGPSLGTTATGLWSAAAALLTSHRRVVGWDLPGHGRSAPATGFDVPALSRAVLTLADELGARTFTYAGDSLGGAVGLQLLLDAPDRVTAAALICTGARIGEPQGWRERAATVHARGTASLLEHAGARWFGAGFAQRQPTAVESLLAELAGVDDAGYAAACEALAAFDVTDRLAAVAAPVVAVAGAEDVVVPVADLRRVAAGVQRGRCVVLAGVGHLAPVEAPAAVAELIAGCESAPAVPTTAAVRAAGLQVRREVLGDAHVERALDRTTELTAGFQDFITQYAWGGIWTRPGLDRRSRSLITLTALVARGHDEEFALHLRAARRNGVTTDEVKELLLQLAIYCGVPAANTAFRIAQQVFDEDAAGPGS